MKKLVMLVGALLFAQSALAQIQDIKFFDYSKGGLGYTGSITNFGGQVKGSSNLYLDGTSNKVNRAQKVYGTTLMVTAGLVPWGGSNVVSVLGAGVDAANGFYKFNAGYSGWTNSKANGYGIYNSAGALYLTNSTVTLYVCYPHSVVSDWTAYVTTNGWSITNGWYTPTAAYYPAPTNVTYPPWGSYEVAAVNFSFQKSIDGVNAWETLTNFVLKTTATNVWAYTNIAITYVSQYPYVRCLNIANASTNAVTNAFLLGTSKY